MEERKQVKVEKKENDMDSKVDSSVETKHQIVLLSETMSHMQKRIDVLENENKTLMERLVVFPPLDSGKTAPTTTTTTLTSQEDETKRIESEKKLTFQQMLNLHFQLQRLHLKLDLRSWLDFVVPKWHPGLFYKEETFTKPPFLATHVRPHATIQLGNVWSEDQSTWRASMCSEGCMKWKRVSLNEIVKDYVSFHQQIVHSHTESVSVIVALPRCLL